MTIDRKEKRDLLSFQPLGRKEIEAIFSFSRKLKQDLKRGIVRPRLPGKALAMVFEKPSLRTRVSFETGMIQLGGSAIFLGPDEIQLGVRESAADGARVLSRWADLIVVRTFSQETLEEMARCASVPVINGLTDLYHPCQVLADCFTLIEKKRKLEGLKIAFVGDGNNVANSWIEAASRLPFSLVVACPKGYEPDATLVAEAKDVGARVEVTDDVEGAARGADVLYTDVWTSMGQEAEAQARRRAFRRYQLNRELLARAKPDAVVMHCLPAHRNEEITHDVMEGPQSIIFDQAENRLHVQKGIMVWALKGMKGLKS
ncbi:MAG TPA: ornithine carbamoyltransferase [Candidatus Binatia bacterium]|nr:ornithine carbamoyltransferase [Candidatus Binatia bacterium]